MLWDDYEKKLSQLEKLIESTPYDGERYVAKKKYAKLKQKYILKSRKYAIRKALLLWNTEINPDDVQNIYEKYCVKYDAIASELKQTIPAHYIEATMVYWDYGFKNGLSIFKWKSFPVMPYTPYGWDYFLIGKAFGYRLALEKKNATC